MKRCQSLQWKCIISATIFLIAKSLIKKSKALSIFLFSFTFLCVAQDQKPANDNIKFPKQNLNKTFTTGSMGKDLSSSSFHNWNNRDHKGKIDYSEKIGFTHWGGRYHFKDENSFLTEGANVIRELGAGIIKLALTPNYKEDYRFIKNWPENVDSMKKLAGLEHFHNVFTMKELETDVFDVIVLVAYSFGTYDLIHPDGFESYNRFHAYKDLKEFYNLTKHLMAQEEYEGKTFILQTWAGDWQLMGYDLVDPTPRQIYGFKLWINARQMGVDQARNELEDSDVDVYHALEVNLIGRCLEGEPCVTDLIVPDTHCDLYSYSMWESADEDEIPPILVQRLNHLAAQAPDNEYFGDKNVYIGEFGAPENIWGLPDGKIKLESTIETAIGWGTPWLIFWQVFDNELLECPGFWLRKLDGSYSTYWSFFSNLYRENPDYSPRLGVAHWGGKYYFTDDPFLQEGADEIEKLGTRFIKLGFSRNYQMDYPFNHIWAQYDIQNMTALANTDYFRYVFEKFDVILLEAYCFATHGKLHPDGGFEGYTHVDAKKDFDEFSNLTMNLITKYHGTNKIFILQSWEGDNQLLGYSDDMEDPTELEIEGFIRWMHARQEGVEHGRRRFGESSVKVWHAMEVNAISRSLDSPPQPCVTDLVVPFTHCDLYSYSMWETWALGDPVEIRQNLVERLNRLKERAWNDGPFGDYCVYIGEFGAPENHDMCNQYSCITILDTIINTYMDWVEPNPPPNENKEPAQWINYWEVYDNECKYFGNWLIKDDNTKSAYWDYFEKKFE